MCEQILQQSSSMDYQNKQPVATTAPITIRKETKWTNNHVRPAPNVLYSIHWWTFHVVISNVNRHLKIISIHNHLTKQIFLNKSMPIFKMDMRKVKKRPTDINSSRRSRLQYCPVPWITLPHPSLEMKWPTKNHKWYHKCR